jgi:predicted GNAT family N-acyltransferase
MEFRFIDTGDALYEGERFLRSKALREPMGLPLGAEIFPFENESLHLIAINEDKVIGCALFHPEGKSGRLYQMAVALGNRGRGVGTALLETMERTLRKQGFTSLYLHAREEAVSFYERLGYRKDGASFLEIGIRHLKMTKVLNT